MPSEREPSWENWFSDQYDLTDAISKMVKERTEGRSDAFKAAVIFAIIEELSEDVRAYLKLPDSDGGPAQRDGGAHG